MASGTLTPFYTQGPVRAFTGGHRPQSKSRFSQLSVTTLVRQASYRERMLTLFLRHAAVVACVLLIFAKIPQPPEARGTGSPDPARAAELRARGIDLGFNLDYPEALAAFREAIAADPGDPAAYRMAAATLWVSLLFQQGMVTTDDYTGRARAKIAKKPPPPDIAAAFFEYTNTAISIAEKRVRENPRDADAHFQIGSAAGFQASYATTVEGRVLGGLGPARRAYTEHARCMALDPARKDAGLIVGLYLYGVSALPAPMRWLARLAGFGSGHDEGLRLVEEAAAYPAPVQTNARFTLILLYNREGRYLDALRVIQQLQVQYPRNRLLWLEAGSTALRAGRATEALAALDEGFAKLANDARPPAFGEQARWNYQRGATLLALQQDEAAEHDLRSVLAAQAQQWVRGRAHLELGKLADRRAQRPQALQEYRLAIADCRAQRDEVCADGAQKLMGRAGKLP